MSFTGPYMYTAAFRGLRLERPELFEPPLYLELVGNSWYLGGYVLYYASQALIEERFACQDPDIHYSTIDAPIMRS